MQFKERSLLLTSADSNLVLALHSNVNNRSLTVLSSFNNIDLMMSFHCNCLKERCPPAVKTTHFKLFHVSSLSQFFFPFASK